MASKALICSASPLVANKSLSNPKSIGFGPRSLVPIGPSSLKTSASRLLLVVRALEPAAEGGLSKEASHLSHLIDPTHFHKKVAMLDTAPYMRTPWNTSEDEAEIRMWFDVPGLAAQDIDVNVVDNFLVIKGSEGLDAFGRKIYSPFDCKLHLPFNCAKEETQAVLKNGVLYINVPKITKMEHMKFIHVPVRAVA